MVGLSKLDLCRSLPGNFVFNHSHDVGLLHDQEFFALNLDLSARPFPEQHLISRLQIDGDELAALIASTRTDCNHFALHWFFLGSVGNDDAAFGLGVFFNAAQNEAVVQWTKVHEAYSV